MVGLRKNQILFGFIDQGFMSAVNFGLSLSAGRILGPAGLGRVFIGFAGYLIVLGLLRALVSEPFLTMQRSKHPHKVAEEQRLAASVAFGFSLASAAIFILLGFSIQGDIGRSLLLFAPWIIPTLMHDYWRVILFRERKGSSAALHSAYWALVMSAALYLSHDARSDGLIVASWGLGGTVGMFFGFIRVGSFPFPRRRAVKWWRARLMPVASWFAGGSVIMTVGSYMAPFLLLAIIGPGALGGLRAVQSIFAPVSLIGAGLTLPGLPATVRQLTRSVSYARRYVLRLSGLAVLLVVIYLSVIALGGGELLSFLFGDRFRQFSSLMIPIGFGQVLTAAYLGPVLFLKGLRRARRLASISAVMAATSVLGSTGLGSAFGVEGAAWGLALGVTVGTVLMMGSTLRRVDAYQRDLRHENVVAADLTSSRNWAAGDN